MINKDNQRSILEMARGAIMERVDYEMAKVLDNIMDANTKASAKRKLTVTLTFQPDEERTQIAVDTVAKSTLAPTNPVVTSLYVTGSHIDGQMQVVEMVPQIPGQVGIDGQEQDDPSVLKVIHAAF